MKKIPFSPPKMDKAIIDEVVATLNSGWITTGPRTKALEKEVEKLAQVPKVLCVNSCTGGLELMMRWLGIQEGDEVIIPAFTYCATANVVLHCGATPIMVDIKPDDLTIDIEAVKNAITTKTKAIVPVDLGGMPVDYTKLLRVVKSNDIKNQFQPRTDIQKQLNRIAVITDAAHSIGASYLDQPAAKQADITVFSFHAVKNLTTAEGGAICLNLPDSFDLNEIYAKLNSKTVHGQSKDALAKFGKNSWEYDVVEAGYKFNMPDVLAAIGLVEIKRYQNETLTKRKAIFDIYSQLLSKYEWAELPVYKTAEKISSYHLYLLRIKNISLEQRNAIINRIFDAGVSVNVHYKPLPELTLYKKLGYQSKDYPISLDTFHRVITLPVFYDLEKKQVDRVVEVIVEAVEHYL
ncbi:MAG: DegT/DnrJ/EryC1/StrS family aminotransferase [Saprospiraceae bacterium]|jgi:dTDP-4-amino-4,6-dideoxygalactose transaminase|nr:DegT/DnrJ/EryC1/StrS family aminotransferase [bacterium]MDC3210484.1 DegT/DnrJ/EryC1/StrS family aminotransferase [Saprospiraceae bacterium]MDC3219594.1 DegT/DnrJ/EryC1/StrS family aminotransferase [Saprospiraceae bacterium]MDG1432437.1 DegT/DnrJ/EryC1/StrS family aminotransferase [Saprospiraceae bacterium]MDG2418187.1 DegT/DnrJ/EryC1/StrS family aminotransferase [Saprospiraceae bacterium]